MRKRDAIKGGERNAASVVLFDSGLRVFIRDFVVFNTEQGLLYEPVR
jgi:hypothetical protein